MNVLLFGSGGREHAIAWKLRQSQRLGELYIAPGNAGTAELGRNVQLHVQRSAGGGKGRVPGGSRRQSARTSGRPGLGRARRPAVLGPRRSADCGGHSRPRATQAAARLEASKAWAKQLMQRHAMPHTRTAIFDDAEAARAYVRVAQGPVVVKADGLAVGKGAIVTASVVEALAAIDDCRRLGTRHVS
jgi:phosphoribosylamine---glycine ligase